MTIKSQRRFTALFALAVLAAFSSQVNAACKGQSEDACSTDASCAWIGSYERRDGVKINGYCRTRSGGKTEAEAKPSEPLEPAGKS